MSAVKRLQGFQILKWPLLSLKGTIKLLQTVGIPAMADLQPSMNSSGVKKRNTLICRSLVRPQPHTRRLSGKVQPRKDCRWTSGEGSMSSLFLCRNATCLKTSFSRRWTTMTILIIFSSYHQPRRKTANQRPKIRSWIKAGMRQKPPWIIQGNISRPLIRITNHRQKGLSKMMRSKSSHRTASATNKQVPSLLAREAAACLQQIKLFL